MFANRWLLAGITLLAGLAISHAKSRVAIERQRSRRLREPDAKLIATVWNHFPRPFEISSQDPEAIKDLLRAIGRELGQ